MGLLFNFLIQLPYISIILYNLNIFNNFRKEAQKCFCEALNCRGWIGDNPEDNKEKDEYTEDVDETDDETTDEDDDSVEDKEDKGNKEEKPKKQIRRKREEKKVTDHMEDEDVSFSILTGCQSPTVTTKTVLPIGC